MIVYLFILVLCAGAILELVLSAPDGWEDENGFHLGQPDNTKFRGASPVASPDGAAERGAARSAPRSNRKGVLVLHVSGNAGKAQHDHA